MNCFDLLSWEDGLEVNFCFQGYVLRVFLKTLLSKMLGVILQLPCHGEQFGRIAQFNGVMLAILPPSR